MKQETAAWLCAALLLAALPLNSRAASRGQSVQPAAMAKLSLPTYHALIIGINSYEHWTPLRQAHADAQELAKLLKQEYGFTHVRELYDRQATRTNIFAALRRLTQELGPQDALLIYYAGHGYYDRLLQKGYWIPSEARAKAGGDPATTEWVGNSDLKEHLEAMKARHVLVVSDSCFSGALMRSATEEIAAKENAWYRRAITMPSRWLLTSGSLEAVPDRSVFAAKFRQVIQYPKQEVFAASDVAVWIRNEIAEATGLQPLSGSIKGLANSPEGEFIFLHGSTGRALIQKEAMPLAKDVKAPKPNSSPSSDSSPPVSNGKNADVFASLSVDLDSIQYVFPSSFLITLNIKNGSADKVARLALNSHQGRLKSLLIDEMGNRYTCSDPSAVSGVYAPMRMNSAQDAFDEMKGRISSSSNRAEVAKTLTEIGPGKSMKPVFLLKRQEAHYAELKGQKSPTPKMLQVEWMVFGEGEDGEGQLKLQNRIITELDAATRRSK